MKNNTVYAIYIVMASLSTMAAIAGATFLAYEGKDGWGWLIFLALCIGSMSITSGKSDEAEPEKKLIESA